jgi:hypothetical protein
VGFCIVCCLIVVCFCVLCLLLCCNYSFYVFLLFVLYLFSCFVCFAFYFVCCFVLCIVSRHVYSCFISICVQVYWPLPPGANQISVNEYHIICKTTAVCLHFVARSSLEPSHRSASKESPEFSPESKEHPYTRTQTCWTLCATQEITTKIFSACGQHEILQYAELRMNKYTYNFTWCPAMHHVW